MKKLLLSISILGGLGALLLLAQSFDYVPPQSAVGIHIVGGTSPTSAVVLSCGTPNADPNCALTLQSLGTGILSLLGSPKFDCSTGTASANAVTINKPCGVITSSTANLAAATTETITLTDSAITAATNLILATINNPCTTGDVMVESALAASGSATIKIRNVNAASACASTYKVGYLVSNN